MEIAEKREQGWILEYIAKYVLSQSHWKNHLFLRQLTQGKTPTLKRLSKAIEDGTWDQDGKNIAKTN